jgi:2-iminobutanoate/2-iminopropanoate deaminase
MKETTMELEAITVPGAPIPVAPLSPAIRASGLVFVSGQLPVDKTGAMPEGMPAQTRQCMENVKSLLEAAGTGLGRVVKCTVFITNMDDFARMNEVYGRYFGEIPPARACVEVSRLAKNALVEIEAIALA